MPTKKNNKTTEGKPKEWGQIECYAHKSGETYTIRIPGLIYLSGLTKGQLDKKIEEFNRTCKGNLTVKREWY